MTHTVLTTERLTLRRPVAEDFDSFAAFAACDRSKWVGGPVCRAEAWDGFAQNLGHWELRGFGYFCVILNQNSETVGRVGLRRTEDRPETELAFSLFDEKFEGKGLAFEAAIAVRYYAWNGVKLPSLVSYIAPDNTRSRKLAERLGATMDPDAPKWEKYDDLLVYRYNKENCA